MKRLKNQKYSMGKGRDKELIQLRNKKLLLRYYELTEIGRRRFDDTVKILSREEFFISEKTVFDIIQKYYNPEDYVAKAEKGDG